MENAELYKKMMRIAVEKRQDIDFIKTTMMKKEFEYVDPNEFLGLKKVLIIGLANRASIMKILETGNGETEFILLEEDEKYLELMKEELNGLHCQVKIQLCNVEHLSLDKEELDRLMKDSSALIPNS